MPSELKRLLTREMAREIEGLDDLLLVDASKLPARENGDLRGKMEASGMQMLVVKNHLLSLAARTADLPSLDALLEGPVAVVKGGEGAADIARLIAEWNRSHTAVQIKGGLIEGRVGNAEEADSWASLPSRNDLLAQLLGDILSPASGLAAAFHATQAQFAGLVAAHIDSLKEE